MSSISVPVLLRVPSNFKPNWRRVFETFVSPIHLIRSIREIATRKSIREPSLSVEELRAIGAVAISVDGQVLRTLEQLHGVPHKYKTWLAARNLRDRVQVPLSSLRNFEHFDRTSHPSYRKHFLAEIQKTVIEESLKFREIPPLKKLLKAMTNDGEIEHLSPAGDDNIGISALLVQAIDNLLTFIRECEAEHSGIPAFKLPRFHELDRAVVIPTYSAGFTCLLPNTGGFAHLFDAEAKAPTELLGSTNLPGACENGLFLIRPETWFAQMTTLRAMAAQRAAKDMASETQSELPAEPERSPRKIECQDQPEKVESTESKHAASLATPGSDVDTATRKPRRKPNAERDEWIRSQNCSASRIKVMLDSKIASTHSRWKPIGTRSINRIIAK